MAMRAALLPAVLLAVLSLGSCQVLEFVFGSIFPSTTTLIKAQANLSSQIPAANASTFTIRVLETGGFGYVVVVGTLPDTGITAFLYDLNLNPKATYTGLSGPGVMVDASGLIIVGSHKLNPDLSPAGTGSISPVSLGSSGSGGVDGFVSSGININGVATSGATLNRSAYDATWAQLALPAASVISATQSSLQVNAVLDDGSLSVILVISPTGGNNNKVTGYFLTAAKSNFTAAGVLTGLLDVSPHRDNLDRESFGFAQGSIFAYDVDSSSFLRIDPATAATQASFSSGTDPDSTRFAYRVSGGSFYGFDTKTRALTMYTAWW